MMETIEFMNPSQKVVFTKDGVFQQGEALIYESENDSTYETINAETDANGISIQEFKDLIVLHWDELEKLHESHHKN